MPANPTSPDEEVIYWDQEFKSRPYRELEDPMGFYRVDLPSDDASRLEPIKIYSDDTGSTYSVVKHAGFELVTTLDMKLKETHRFLFMPKFAVKIVRDASKSPNEDTKS